MDFQNGLFRWFSQALPLTSFTDVICRLVLAESVLIPASSSLVCNAKIQSYDGSLMQAVGEQMFLPGRRCWIHILLQHQQLSTVRQV